MARLFLAQMPKCQPCTENKHATGWGPDKVPLPQNVLRSPWGSPRLPLRPPPAHWSLSSSEGSATSLLHEALDSFRSCRVKKQPGSSE